MEPVFILLALAALVVALCWWWLRRSAATPNAHPGKRSLEHLDTLMAWTPEPTRILTSTERQAYMVLRRALPDHVIFAQVPLARFLKVPTRHSYSEWVRRVGQLCADFVVCDNASQVIAVVEVRAPEGQEKERTLRRQARMDRVLQAAGLPLHVWRENQIPSATAARLALLEHMAEDAQDTGLDDTRPEAANGASRVDSNFPIINGVRERREEPPPSTWFDDLDSGPMPLGPAPTSRPH